MLTVCLNSVLAHYMHLILSFIHCVVVVLWHLRFHPVHEYVTRLQCRQRDVGCEVMTCES